MVSVGLAVITMLKSIFMASYCKSHMNYRIFQTGKFLDVEDYRIDI